jgi:hypothetical protein
MTVVHTVLPVSEGFVSKACPGRTFRALLRTRAASARSAAPPARTDDAQALDFAARIRPAVERLCEELNTPCPLTSAGNRS